MKGISTFLWFDHQAEQAARHYVSIFPNSRLLADTVFHEQGPSEDRDVTVVSFELDGRPFSAFNGGPMFSFTPAMSFVVSCEDQVEVDYYWERLCEGGEESMCGWLIDRFGVSWQVVPTVLGDLIGGNDPTKAARATHAMLQMRKLDISELQRAYEGG